MAEIVNLRRARKQRQRAEAARAAAPQRLLHGRTKAERKLQEAEQSRADKTLHNARLDPDDAG